ncbi:hypothetical protein VP01_421g5 [Puccinia sorghi]|uniref:DUF7918 domain-containing protein n=1 Tax=Puccinia sorghi TaxID=27349 RepID=A0A0L6URF8_9BASI|nr:hypothetical protein VP01_421g5 [Puccinia sorghi]
MPINQTTGTRCSVLPLDHPSLPVGLPSIEYKHHTMKSTITGAIQEIAIIESNQGTSFEISLDIKPTAYATLHQPDQQLHRLPEDDYLIYVLLDGINAQRSKRHRSQRTPTRISGVLAQDRSSSRSFQFGSLHLVDPDDHQQPTDQSICQDEKIIQALGTIQINIVRCSLGQPKPVPRRPNRAGGNPNRASHPCPESLKTTNQMMFSERTKKACLLNNTVGLSQPVPNSSSGSFPAKRSIRPIVREDPQPFLQFIFKYKPRSVLEAEGIIAPPPPPPPSPPPHSSADNLKSTCMTSPTKPAISEQTRLGHDYQSNSELHKSSLNPNAQSTHEVDEKACSSFFALKPKMKEKPVYIHIDSDSDSESVPKSVNRAESGRPLGSTSHTTSNKPFPKPEPRDHDDLTHQEANKRHKQGNTDSKKRDMLDSADCKKRARSTTADVKPNKRVSMGDAPSATTAANASASRDIPKTQLKENINLHPTLTRTNTTRANATQQYRNNSSFEESSDDDDQFKKKIIAPGPVHSARPSQLDRSPTKPSPWALNQLNNPIKSVSASQEGPNFFDLTGIHDDSD